MSTDAVALLLALLTVASWVASAVLLAAHLSPGLKTRTHEVLSGQILPLALLVAAVSMAGSLYLSEVAGFIPCNLCWYQRIAMYPQVLLLAIAWYRRDEGIRTYVLPMAVIGACISIFHVLVERFPWIEGSGGVCDPANPCTIKWIEELGFITIPTMALSAFVLIALLMTHLSPGAAHPDEHAESDATRHEPSPSEPTQSEAP